MNSFAITIIVIILSTLLAGFFKRNTKDKCIKDFKQNTITLLTSENKFITGRMIVESTGLEFILSKSPDNILTDGVSSEKRISFDNETSLGNGTSPRNETFMGNRTSPGKTDELFSYILYKTEFAKMTALIRYHKNLNEKDKLIRENEIEKTYHPSRIKRIKRYILNLLKLLKDSMMEIFTALTGQVTKLNAAKNINPADINQTNKIQKELVNSIDPAYDPLLEKYIGNFIILEFNLNNTPIVLKGILKEYTSEYIELLDTLIKTEKDTSGAIADIVVPRRIAVIRGLGEEIKEYAIGIDGEFKIPKYKLIAKKSLSAFLNKDENFKV